MASYIVDTNIVKALLPELNESLDLINQALRNINMGKMDHLPYYAAVPGIHVLMQAELSPQGDKRPPAVGHWQLLIAKDGAPYHVCLHGKVKGAAERAEVIFVCPDTPQEVQVADAASSSNA